MTKHDFKGFLDVSDDAIAAKTARLSGHGLDIGDREACVLNTTGNITEHAQPRVAG